MAVNRIGVETHGSKNDGWTGGSRTRTGFPECDQGGTVGTFKLPRALTEWRGPTWKLKYGGPCGLHIRCYTGGTGARCDSCHCLQSPAAGTLAGRRPPRTVVPHQVVVHPTMCIENHGKIPPY